MAPRRLVKSNFSANKQEEPTTPPHSLNKMELKLTGTNRIITLLVAAPDLTVIGTFTATVKRGTWLLYSQPNYRGELRLADPAARSQAEAITQSAIQSARPLMGEIILYANFNYIGTSLVLTESTTDLGSFNFNNTVSSARVISGKWQLYEGIKYQSTSYTTSGDPEALSPIPGLSNDSLSSVEFIPEA